MRWKAAASPGFDKRFFHAVSFDQPELLIELWCMLSVFGGDTENYF
jgi:hypothetical protein